jgi:hypothetical protein
VGELVVRLGCNLAISECDSASWLGCNSGSLWVTGWFVCRLLCRLLFKLLFRLRGTATTAGMLRGSSFVPLLLKVISNNLQRNEV